MNVSCSKCSAKYMVPDGRVQGRKVKIRCKQCSEQIVIDGTAAGEDEGEAEGGRSHLPKGAANQTLLGLQHRERPEPPRLGQAEPKKIKSTRSTIMGGVRAPALSRSAAPRQDYTWTVAISDDERVETNTAGVIELYRGGRIDEHAFIWRDGMEEWATLPEIEELKAALDHRSNVSRLSALPRPSSDKGRSSSLGPRGTGLVPRPGSVAAGAPRKSVVPELPRMREPVESEPMFSEDELTLAIDAPFEARARPLSNLTPIAPEVLDSDDRETLPPAESFPPAPDSIVPLSGRDLEPIGKPPLRSELSEYDIKSSPAIQRPSMVGQRPSMLGQRPSMVGQRPSMVGLPKPRGADVTSDLFGAEPVARHHDSDDPPPLQPAQGMTGERGENSVLFSLDSLLAANKAHAEPRRPDKAPLFSTDLGTPLMAAPPRPPVSIVQPSDLIDRASRLPQPPTPAELDAALIAGAPTKQRSSKRGVLWAFLLILCGAALPFIIKPELRGKVLGGGEDATARQEKPTTLPTEAQATSVKPEPVGVAPTSGAVAPVASAGPIGANKAAASPPSLAGDTAGQSAGSRLPTGALPPTLPTGTKKPTTTGEPSTTPLPPRDTKPTTDPKPPEPDDEGGEAPPFNTPAAAAALSQAAASAASCQQAGGASGAGRARVTFSPSGRATTATISGDLAGTSVGGCVARLFQRSRVPAFTGAPVSVTKSFTVP